MDQEDFRYKVEEIQRLASQAEAEVTSDDHAVRIVAGPGGRIIDLELTQRAFAMSGAELGRKIVETLQQARTKVETELSSSIGRLMGDPNSANLFGGGLDSIKTQFADDKREQR